MAAASYTPQLVGTQRPTVDYQSAFVRDVIRQPESTSEEEWHEALRLRARESGLDVDALSSHKAQSECTTSSNPSRRSASAYSITSQSTGVTSNLSDLSRGPRRSNCRSQRDSRTSLSLRDYDIFLARGTTDEQRTSISFSRSTTPADSVLSLPLYSPAPSPRRQSRVLKGLSLLRLHRPDQLSRVAGGCLHCPRDSLSQRRAVHKLPCGHRLCTQALRSTVKAALESTTGAVPSCCGLPIPGILIHNVMTHEEQDVLLDKLGQWDEALSPAPSVQGFTKEWSSASSNVYTGARKMSLASKDDSLREAQGDGCAELRDRDGFEQLYDDQTALRDSFLVWVAAQSAELQATHERVRAEMMTQHESARESMTQNHDQASADAEDKQVKAEADLRQSHAQEKRDNATALKHMEAYCAGAYSTGEAHNRPVTEQDLAELAKARRTRDMMGSKHDSAINVLRGEQAGRMSLREKRHERASQELRRAQRLEEAGFERACMAEMQEFEAFVMEKQHRLSVRWTLQNAMLAKTLGLENAVPTLQWPPVEQSTARPA